MLVVLPRNTLLYLKNREFGFIRQLIRAIWWNISNNRDSKYLGFKN
jgi:hypothetical protein